MDDVWACTVFRLRLWRFGDLLCHFINSPGSLITVPAGVLVTPWGQFCASCCIRTVGSGQIPHSHLSVPQTRHILTFKKDEWKTKIARSSKEIPRRRAWQPTPVLWPGESHGQRSLAGYSPQGCEESDTTERLTLHSLRVYVITCTHSPGFSDISVLLACEGLAQWAFETAQVVQVCQARPSASGGHTGCRQRLRGAGPGPRSSRVAGWPSSCWAPASAPTPLLLRWEPLWSACWSQGAHREFLQTWVGCRPAAVLPGESPFLARWGGLLACVKTQIHRPKGEAVPGLVTFWLSAAVCPAHAPWHVLS